jgi:hypothetical protein
VRFCLDGNSCAGLKGLCPSPGIKYYADGNSCAPKKKIERYYWGHGKLGRCVIQLSKFLNHTLATHNQVDSFFENISHNDGKGAFTLTLFEMTITDCPGFHVPHCTGKFTCAKIPKVTRCKSFYFTLYNIRLNNHSSNLVL